MAFATSKNMDSPRLQIKRSAWTPLNNQLMNEQVFEERRALLRKWFIKWTDGQKQKILEDQLKLCSLSLQKFCAKQLLDRLPIEALDFTMKLPRALTLYIFSFLDPRSLCRCAQVSWHWKNLSELDQLWKPKCLRFGWYLNFIPTLFERGIWKRHYIEMVKELHVTIQKTPSKDDSVVSEVQKGRSYIPEAKPSMPRKKTSKKKEMPPWRSSDRCPTDTVRFNCLDNYDPIEQARQARKKGGGEIPDLSQQAAEKNKKAGCGFKKLHKSKSMLSLNEGLKTMKKPPVHPTWATPPSTGNLPYKEAAKTIAQSSQHNARIRPVPVQAPLPKPLAREKTSILFPTCPQCEAQPKLVPLSNSDLIQTKGASGASFFSVEQKLTYPDGEDKNSVA